MHVQRRGFKDIHLELPLRNRVDAAIASRQAVLIQPSSPANPGATQAASLVQMQWTLARLVVNPRQNVAVVDHIRARRCRCLQWRVI